MRQMPRDNRLDATIAFLRDPYRFISGQCRALGSDLFETRLMLAETICMSGAETARLFYDEHRFIRHNAMPPPIQKTLLGVGGVQGLDDEHHRARKRMLMSLMTPEHIDQLVAQTAREWQDAIALWSKMGQLQLYPALHTLLTQAVCAWAGVPLEDIQAAQRVRDIAALFDQAGAIGPGHFRSRWARTQTERWLQQLVGDIRTGKYRPSDRSAAHVIAWHRDPRGELLAPHIAAVELLNVLRPTVAVAVYIVFIAHALRQHPAIADDLRTGTEEKMHLFVQEVRRFYPFFPAIAARVRRTFEWNGYVFPEGRRVILDLYGTNQDPRVWDDPRTFNPDRFRRWQEDPFSFIPQGGGDHYRHHRCAGEWITLALMRQATAILTQRIRYDVPEQDLSIDWSRLPALPRSGFSIRNVRSA